MLLVRRSYTHSDKLYMIFLWYLVGSLSVFYRNTIYCSTRMHHLLALSFSLDMLFSSPVFAFAFSVAVDIITVCCIVCSCARVYAKFIFLLLFISPLRPTFSNVKFNALLQRVTFNVIQYRYFSACFVSLLSFQR